MIEALANMMNAQLEIIIFQGHTAFPGYAPELNPDEFVSGQVLFCDDWADPVGCAR